MHFRVAPNVFICLYHNWSNAQRLFRLAVVAVVLQVLHDNVCLCNRAPRGLSASLIQPNPFHLVF